MDYVKLDGNLSLAMEPCSAGLRLMIFDGDEGTVCHKIRIKTLRDFLRAEEGHLFKGRLQLDRSGDDILVSVKNNKAGTIEAADLAQLINTQLSVSL